MNILTTSLRCCCTALQHTLCCLPSLLCRQQLMHALFLHSSMARDVLGWVGLMVRRQTAQLTHAADLLHTSQLQLRNGLCLPLTLALHLALG